jgi:drug/metabolite transporter (DMT)-like permease
MTLMSRWLFHSLLTMVFWGIWGFIPSKLGQISAEQQQILSTLGLLPIIIVLACARQRLHGTRIKRGCIVALVGGLVGSVGNLLFLRLLSVEQNATTVVPLTSLYPMVTVVLAVVLLREKLNGVQLAGIGLALVSIYFFNPTSQDPWSMRWLGFAVLPMGCWAVAALLQKLCTNDVSAELSTLCFLLAQMPISLLLLFSHSLNWQLTPHDWSWGAALGLFLGLGNLTCLAAFSAGGKAAIVSPLVGVYSLVTVLLAVTWGGEKVSLRHGLAIGLALLAVIALAVETPAAAAGQDAPVRS